MKDEVRTWNCYVLECSAPSGGHDRFVARSPRAVLRWLQQALVTRGLGASKLVELAFDGQLDCHVQVVLEGSAQPAIDLRSALTVAVEDVPPVPVLAADRLAALRRRLTRRPEDEPVFELNESAVESLLPPLPEPILEPGRSLQLQARTLPFGATLADASERFDDPDPVERPAANEGAPLPPLVVELFDAVYREPDALERRAVLADALLELGDPRGEFIRLQLAPQSAATSRAVQGLLERNEATWLDDLTRILKDPEWRNGFLHAATLIEQYPALLRRPELSTLRELWFRCDAPFSPSLANLERATGVRHFGLTALTADGHARLRHLGVDIELRLNDYDVEADARDCFRAAQLPALRVLSVEAGLLGPGFPGNEGGLPVLDRRRFDWLWPLPLLRQLETFKTTQLFQSLGSWLAVPPAELPVPRIVLKLATPTGGTDGWATRMRTVKPIWVALRKGSDELLALHRELDESHRDLADPLKQLLAACANTAWKSIRFYKRAPTAADRASGVELVESLPPPGTF